MYKFIYKNKDGITVYESTGNFNTAHEAVIAGSNYLNKTLHADVVKIDYKLVN